MTEALSIIVTGIVSTAVLFVSFKVIDYVVDLIALPRKYRK